MKKRKRLYYAIISIAIIILIIILGVTSSKKPILSDIRNAESIRIWRSQVRGHDHYETLLVLDDKGLKVEYNVRAFDLKEYMKYNLKREFDSNSVYIRELYGILPNTIHQSGLLDMPEKNCYNARSSTIFIISYQIKGKTYRKKIYTGIIEQIVEYNRCYSGSEKNLLQRISLFTRRLTGERNKDKIYTLYFFNNLIDKIVINAFREDLKDKYINTPTFKKFD